MRRGGAKGREGSSGSVYGASCARLRLSTALSSTLCGLAALTTIGAAGGARAQTQGWIPFTYSTSAASGGNGENVDNYIHSAFGGAGGTGASLGHPVFSISGSTNGAAHGVNIVTWGGAGGVGGYASAGDDDGNVGVGGAGGAGGWGATRRSPSAMPQPQPPRVPPCSSSPMAGWAVRVAMDTAAGTLPPAAAVVLAGMRGIERHSLQRHPEFSG